MKLLAAFFLFLAGLLGSLAAQAEASALEALQATLRPIEQMQGAFSQRQYAADGSLTGESAGRFRLLRPGYFAWEITSPDSQLIIADPDYLWQYDRDLETVTRRPVDDSQALSPLQVLGGDAGALAEHYAVARDERGRFLLVPRAAEAGFQSLALDISGELFRGMEVLDNLGQRVVIEFADVRFGGELSPADFDFVPPPEADLFYHDGE